MASERRMGLESSATRATLMDAVETVMREDGYAALSARSVAERAGLKHQLVFYYFRTMDDLLLATYRRRTARMLERIEQALQSERPLHAFWAALSNPLDAALTMEYMALSNHNAAIHAETTAFGEQVRHVEAEKLARLLRPANSDPSAFTPIAIATAITYIAHNLGFEAAMGISGGHPETRALVEWCLGYFEATTEPVEP